MDSWIFISYFYMQSKTIYFVVQIVPALAIRISFSDSCVSYIVQFSGDLS